MTYGDEESVCGNSGLGERREVRYVEGQMGTSAGWPRAAGACGSELGGLLGRLHCGGLFGLFGLVVVIVVIVVVMVVVVVDGGGGWLAGDSGGRGDDGDDTLYKKTERDRDSASRDKGTSQPLGASDTAGCCCCAATRGAARHPALTASRIQCHASAKPAWRWAACGTYSACRGVCIYLLNFVFEYLTGCPGLDGGRGRVSPGSSFQIFKFEPGCADRPAPHGGESQPQSALYAAAAPETRHTAWPQHLLLSSSSSPPPHHTPHHTLSHTQQCSSSTSTGRVPLRHCT